MSERQYLDIMKQILNEGDYREGRNGATYSLFGAQMRFNLRHGFPLLTTKQMFAKGIVAELIWFIRGRTDLEFLHEHKVHFWDANAEAHGGELGPIYGSQWRSWYHVEFPSGFQHYHDQLTAVINGIRTDPYGRRHIVSAWNVGELNEMALPPCHVMFQFHVAQGRLSCHLYQRSGDWFLGVPMNIASYALLTHLVARECGLEVGDFIHTFGDLHIYAEHREQCLMQMRQPVLNFCDVVIADDAPGIFEIEPHQIGFAGYISGSVISARMKV